MDLSYLEDLEYLYNALSKHPSTFLNPNMQAALKAQYDISISKTCSFDSLIDSATEMTVLFNDGHTNIEIPYTESSRCLYIPCSWNANGQLILNKALGNIPVGSIINGVEGVPISELVKLLSHRIPHENEFLVMSRMIKYPYQNYHLFSEMNLTRLFGNKDFYTVNLRVGDEGINAEFALSKYTGYIDFPDQNLIYYDINNDVATLHVDACIYNDLYIQTLKELAAECNIRNISTLILDLSKNMGGNSLVIDEFIRYVNIDQYRRYEITDYSSSIPTLISSRNEFVKNNRAENCFPKNIYCKVSYDTFSSARTFAVTLKDNGIAQIIGEETGGKPCSYGMPHKDCLPNSKIAFRVSRCQFLRPDQSLDNEVTLRP